MSFVYLGMYKIVEALFLPVILFYGHHADGQNLVANGSFENINICTEFKMPCSPNAWFSTRTLSSNGFSHFPGFPAPDGMNCLKLSVASRVSAGREYWQTMLLCPLEAGARYKISVKLASPFIGPNLNDMGFYFTDSLLFSREDTLLQPGSYIDLLGAKIKTLRNGWFALEKEFRADQSKRFLVMGNFSKESNRQILAKRNIMAPNLYLLMDDLVISSTQKGICAGYEKIEDSLYAVRERHTRYGKIDSVDEPVAAPIVQVVPKKIDTLQINNVQFAFDSYTLTNPDTLDLLKPFLAAGDVQKIQVIGFTDDAGTEAYNNALSLKRAREIGRLIAQKFGISESLIEAEGRGISTLYTEKEQNRRVEIYIYHKH
jgi:outer membrane protein OmpA-like peptidoglycan-associated protein